ncbi:DUF2207 domain-containing protein [Streptococcus ictaluri]|uniref:DUF2207 domain-containing protein n=1 Tax=Streptococcus ictaluri 707-05 TaxID=764299 RepID=G5K5A6_9STRE|nr:DUF2207 domain-containing protein [Streptococcus ictaluri]EHI69188.1 hypothetical protein STRIC_2000 [Streptococcus ictaluri 707-05]
MKKWFVFGFILLSFLGAKVGLADVDYRIPSYDGQLYLFDDNTARFEQKVTYQFDSSYNGQYITIGKVGNLPKDFQINPEPHIDIFKNDEKVDFKKEIEDLGDGYRLKLYNSGHSGDRVEVKVFWQLKNLMTLYHDVAEINWLPISDWNQTIEKVTFSVKTPMAVPDARLWAHRGYYEKEPEVTRKDAILRQEKRLRRLETSVKSFLEKCFL